MDGQFDSRRVEKEITVCLAEQLKYLRAYNAVTQREIADALHIDRSTYAYYEKGEDTAAFVYADEAGAAV